MEHEPIQNNILKLICPSLEYNGLKKIQKFYPKIGIQIPTHGNKTKQRIVSSFCYTKKTQKFNDYCIIE